jgi:Mg-chelatase subunit ChlD
MSFLRKNPFITLGVLLLVLVGLPAAIFLSQNQADNRSRAAKTVILSFTPPSTQSSPINVPAGNTVTVDLMIDPGTEAVSFLKTELSYDAAKFQVDNGGFQVNKDAFPQTIQGPVYSSGKVGFAISVGADGTKAIQTPVKVGTLTLRALSSPGTSQVGFSQGTQALSISSSSTPTENVIANTIPANLSVQTGTVISPTQPPNACSNNPSDTMLVIDKSGSMSVASDVNKITQAKIAAKNYVDILSQDTRNTVGLVSYENTATVDSPLTTNYTSVKSQIDSLSAIGSTCTECAILKANQEIAKSQTTQKKIVILLTDGKANYIEGGNQQVDTALAEQKALAAAIAGNSAKGTVFYTIGLGQEINAAFLQQIANSTGGKYFASPTGDQLNSIYQQISVIAAQGSVSGFVFNDANNNKAYDASEAKLSGWRLQLFAQGATDPQTFTSDANGFNITGLCNGTYKLRQVIQTGWKQTIPSDIEGYSFTITNGNVVTDRNFGNLARGTCADGNDNNNNGLTDDKDPICHTDGNPNNPDTYTPHQPELNTCGDRIDNNNNNLIDDKDPICHTDGNPDNPNSYDPDRPETGSNNTSLSLTVFLHGIGNSGDNVNQNLHSLSNKNPLTKTRKAQALIYNTNNQLVASTSGDLKYASASGNFTGTLQTPAPLPAGVYNIRVSSDRHLIRRLPGFQTIVSTGTNQLTAVHLVTGDVNDDNKLNILDYNTIMDCYTDTLPAPSCTDQTKKKITDINDDGSVNGVDYNLFLREIANQPGE